MLYGRGTEQQELRRLIEAAGGGTSGALVVCGEAGIGKSALLGYAGELAAGGSWTVLRATGFEEESDLAFAGLLQLLRTVAGRADALPAPQAEALRTALGAGGTGAGDRFLTGLAVLSLLAEVAEDGPVLCLVDDAQWLDEPSAEALLFAARRLAAEGVAMVFAAREGEFRAAGLPSLRLARLAGEDALGLLDALGVPAPARERVMADSDGNPLAMAEFASAAEELPASPGAPLAAPERVLAAFRAKVMALPERSRLMLQLASAETQCRVEGLLAAAPVFGVGLDDLAEPEARGLVTVAPDRIEFRHPLIRSAAYRSMPTARRVAMHRALADAAEESHDCVAMHRAAAAMGPDEQAAAGLEGYADRALARGGAASAATVYAQAARLSPEAAGRVRRLTAGAWAAQQSGHAELAARLAEDAYGRTADPVERAELAYARSFWLFEDDRSADAARLLIEHAQRLAGVPGHEERVRRMLRTASTYAWFTGDGASLRRTAELLGDATAVDRSVQGLAALAEDDFARGLPLIAELVTDVPEDEDPHTAMQAVSVASLLPDDLIVPLVEEMTGQARRRGWIGRLPYLLHVQARQQIYAGEHREAEATAAEAAAIARDTGLRKRIDRLDNLVARIAAIEGDEERVRRLVSTSLAADGNYGVTALSLLDLGLGRYEAAVDRLAAARSAAAGHSAAMIFAAADEVEAAFRLGDAARAREAAARFGAWAQASGQTWARGVALRNSALLTGDVPLLEEAVSLQSAHACRPFERARTLLLYGEQLRRARRKSEARSHLREALEVFTRLGARPWADRVRTELAAAGDVTAPPVPSSAVSPLEALTPQELQVVRLAAGGTSSRDIAAQLFLSPRTVEYHLYKAYPKLGVSSRRELAGLGL
ncbi:AAA family ATPase [Streptomyces sp. NPDC051940]|uniref:ATP-binding protein n=1 Tax=Streptomyces sp. NPDC051940 TaxID=3155675 RepID=UPI00343AB048